MAITSTATTNFSSTVTALVSQYIEEFFAAKYYHAGQGRRDAITSGHNSLTFVGYPALSVATTPLTEGVSPTAGALTIVTESLTAAQYGNVVGITDVASKESPHDLISRAAHNLADQAANTIDQLVRDVIAAGTSVKYSNGAARSAVSATLTGALVKQMVGNLQDRNVPTFPDGYYRAIISPRAVYDLQADTASGGWMDIHKYSDLGLPNLLSGEVGAFGGCRFLQTTNAKVFTTAGASGKDVLSTVFFGPDAWVLGDIMSLQTYFKAPGGDHSDILAQQALLGWKVMFGTSLISAVAPRYIRLESTGTILSTGA